MRTIDTALEISACPLPINVQTFHPEAKSLPMNEKNDAKGQKWIFKCAGEQGLVCQCSALSGEAGQDGALIAFTIIDMDFKMFGR